MLLQPTGPITITAFLEELLTSPGATRSIDLALPISLVLLTGAALVVAVAYARTVESPNSRYSRLLRQFEASQQREAELLHRQHTLRSLIYERDRHLDEYLLMVKAPYITDAEYETWNKQTWKMNARNQLRQLEWARPLCYNDLRSRVKLLSPTYGKELPTLAAHKNFVDGLFSLPIPTDWPFSEYELPNEVALAVVPEQLAVYNADDVSSFLTELQDAQDLVAEEVAQPAPVVNPAQQFLIELRDQVNAPGQKAG